MSERSTLLAKIEQLQDTSGFRGQHWEGTFEDYLDIVSKNPRACRNAFQRVYDMILSYGTEAYTENREPLVRYNFFKDPMGGGRDSIFGLEDSLAHGLEQQIVMAFQAQQLTDHASRPEALVAIDGFVQGDGAALGLQVLDGG